MCHWSAHVAVGPLTLNTQPHLRAEQESESFARQHALLHRFRIVRRAMRTFAPSGLPSAITALVVIVGTGLAIGSGSRRTAGAIGAAIVGDAFPGWRDRCQRQNQEQRAKPVPIDLRVSSDVRRVLGMVWRQLIPVLLFTTYAAKFGHGNAKLINVGPDLARLLQQSTNQSPPIQSRTPTPSPRSSRASVLDWINRLESYKGSVARQNNS